MKGFFDTSVLVPVFYGDHVHHQASLALFIQFDKSTGCCGAHTLAEVYSTLTRMPGKHRISGEQAMLFIGSIRERLSIIALSGDEYADALQVSAALGIVGGGIYDALLAHCAIKSQSGGDLHMERPSLQPVRAGGSRSFANALKPSAAFTVLLSRFPVGKDQLGDDVLYRAGSASRFDRARTQIRDLGKILVEGRERRKDCVQGFRGDGR